MLIGIILFLGGINCKEQGVIRSRQEDLGKLYVGKVVSGKFGIIV